MNYYAFLNILNHAIMFKGKEIEYDRLLLKVKINF